MRAHARGVREAFLSALSKLGAYLSEGLGEARLSRATLKLLAKATSHLALCPEVYGDKARRLAVRAARAALLASVSDMDEQVFGDFATLYTSTKGGQRVGTASTLDEQRALQMVYGACSLLAAGARHAAAAHSDNFTRVLTFALETTSSLVASSANAALSMCIRKCQWTPSPRNPRKGTDRGSVLATDAVARQVLALCDKDLVHRFAGVRAVLAAYCGAQAVPVAVRAQIVALFATHVLAGTGAASPAVVAAFSESGAFALFTPADMKVDAKIGMAWSTALKRRSTTLVPLLLTRFLAEIKIDLSDSAVPLFLPALLEYMATKVSGWHADDPAHAAGSECASLLMRRISDSGTFTEVLAQVKVMIAGEENASGVVVRKWTQRAGLLSVIESVRLASREKGAQFVARLAQDAIETLFLVAGKATNFEVKRMCYVLAGKWLGSLSGSFAEADEAKSKAVANMAKAAAAGKLVSFDSNTEDAHHAVALCYHSCFSSEKGASGNSNFSSEVLSSVWAAEDVSSVLIPGLSNVVGFAAARPLLQDTGALDASVQAVWMLLALKSVVGAGEHAERFQAAETGVANPASFLYRPFHVPGASEDAELAATRTLEIAIKLDDVAGSEADFFSKWVVPKVKKGKSTDASSASSKKKSSNSSAAAGTKKSHAGGAKKTGAAKKGAKGAKGARGGGKNKMKAPKFAGFGGMKLKKNEDTKNGKKKMKGASSSSSSSTSSSTSLGSSSTPEAQQTAAATSASSFFGFHSHPCLIGLLCALASPLRPNVRSAGASILSRVATARPDLPLKILQALCKDLHVNAENSQRRVTARALSERTATRKRAAALGAFWRAVGGTSGADDGAGKNDDASNVMQEAADYSPRFAMSSGYANLLLSLADPRVVGTCDALPDVVAHLHFLCHHPFVSPQRSKAVGSLDSTHPGINLAPRSDTRTAWRGVSCRLLSSMPAAVEEVQIDGMGEEVQQDASANNAAVANLSPLHYCGVTEAVLALCTSSTVGCFANAGTPIMMRCALRSLVSLSISSANSGITLAPVVTAIVSGLATVVDAVAQFTENECAIYNTPDSVLYVSAEEALRNQQSIEVDRDGEPLNRKLISASKAGLSGRQAMEWDVRVRKEISSLQAIASADKNSAEYIERMSEQAEVRRRVAKKVDVAQAYLTAADALSRTHPTAMRMWLPQMLPAVQEGLQRCFSTLGSLCRRTLEALCACCPEPVNREAVKLARMYHVVRTDPPASAYKQYEGIVRSIVEVVHAAVMMDEEDEEEDGKDEENDEEDVKINPNLLSYSLHAVVPILVATVKAASHVQDKGLVIGCLQIMQQHAVSLPDMPSPHAQAFWRDAGDGDVSSTAMLSPLPVPIRPLRASMMSAALFMQRIAANAAGGLPGILLQDLCAGPAPLSPTEWRVLAGDEGLLSTSLPVRKCGIECLALVESCADESLEETYGDEFPLRLWLLQHDDALEDDAHDVWVECFGTGDAEGGEEKEGDGDNALPEAFAAPLMVLMDHPSAHVRAMASVAVANALEIRDDAASETISALQALFLQKSNGDEDDSAGTFYSSAVLTREEREARRALCRIEVARALGEVSELGVLSEADVQQIFSFLLHNGLTDDDERVQLQMTEAGIALCNAYGKTMNEILIPMFEEAMVEADSGEAAAEASRRAKAEQDMAAAKKKKSKNKVREDSSKKKGKVMVVSADFANAGVRNGASEGEDSAEMTAVKFDRMRKGVVLFMGTTGRFLDPDDTRLAPIVMTLVDALNIPSEQVQKTVSKCLSPLMKVMKQGSQFDDGRAVILALIHKCTKGDSYGVRRGAAWGLAGVTKGLGIACLTAQDVVTKLKKAAGSKTLVEARQGALFAFECLASTLGLLFEPFVIVVLEDMLLLIGDKNSAVREAAEDASRIIMGNLTTHGVKLVLPTLIKAFNAVQWRTKRASITMLGAMAHAAPKQLASCLPQVMPKLTESLKDAQSRVRDAGKAALDDVASVIKNPEVVALVPLLKTALVKPADGLQPALQALEETDFINPVDAASLAMIFPIVNRSLRGRSGMYKSRAAQITADMVHMVEDSLDLVPYLRQLVPQLEKLLTDAVPDVRLTAARSLGRLVRGLGEEHFPETVRTLCTGLFAKSSKVERSGHAQGLCEVLVALGPERLEGCVAELIPQSTHKMSHIREGTLWLLAFLPATMGTHFSKLIPMSLPVILKGLADEADGVREVSMRAGQIVIAQHGNSDTSVVLPSLEESMFDADWRIRQMVGQLLGDLLHKLGGGRLAYNAANVEAEKLGNDPNFKEPEEVAEETPAEKRKRRRLAKMGGAPGSSKSKNNPGDSDSDDEDDDSSDDSDDDDSDNDDDELSTAASGSARSMSSMALLRNIESKLGKETTLRLFAKLYMLRADPNMQVKQQAGNVWKGLITNTGRMLRNMLVQFMATIIEFLASSRDELCIIAGGSLGDVVRKLGDRVTSVILPILGEGIDPAETADSKRQGICLGMLEVIRASSRRLLERNVITLMPIIQTALCDPVEEICETAAQCFNVMQNKLGGSVIDSVVPQLLRDLKNGDKASSEASLQGLRQILALRGKEVLHALMPRLVSIEDGTPSSASGEDEEATGAGFVDLFQAKTLAAICEGTGDIMHFHVDVVMAALTRTLSQCEEKRAAVDSGSDEDAARINLEAAVKSAMRTILVNVEEEGLQWTMTEFVHAATTSKFETVRAAAVWCLGEFCEHAELDFSAFNASIAVALLDRHFDACEKVLLAANSALTQLNKRVKAEVLVDDLKQIRQAINSGVGRAKGTYRKKNPDDDAAASASGGGERKDADVAPSSSRSAEYFVPGFCLKKGLAPVLPVFQHGLIYGSVEVRESSAAGLGEIIKVSTDAAIKPFLNKIAGPLIRVVGDKFPVREFCGHEFGGSFTGVFFFFTDVLSVLLSLCFYRSVLQNY
jgi:hypothetical protein